MKFKRTTAALLAAALAVPTMCITAYAEEDAAMKKALTYVKERMDIPEQCSEFNYSTRSENNSKRYTFTWNVPDDTDYTTFKDGDVYNVRVEITGSVIKNVRVNTYNSGNSWEPSFAKLSDAKLLEAAKKYINEINPGIKKSTVIDEDSLNISLYGNYAYVYFHRAVNGIPVSGQTGNVCIDKNTGALISYYYNWTNGATFSDSKNAISQSEAEKAYKELFGSEINYTLSYDWEKKEYVPHLLYTQSSYGQINAFTGKLSTFEDYDSYGEITDDDADRGVEEAAMADSASGSNKAVTFTPEEIEKLEKESNLITAKQALEMLSKYEFFLVPDNCEVAWENCRYNETGGYYVRSVNFTAKLKDYIDLSGANNPVKPYVVDSTGDYYEDDNSTIWGSFSINAETGELLSYSNYSADNGTSLSEKTAKKIADNAVKTLTGDNASLFAPLATSYTNTRYLEYDRKTGRGIGNPITTSISFRANREAYGITCRDEYVNLTVGNDGYVNYYSCTLHPEVEYPDPTNKVSVNDAYKEFFKVADLSMKYRVAYRSEDKKVVSALVYSSDMTMRVDALTGKVVNYDGSEFVIQTQNGYTDLENSKYKKYAEKLAKYGIYLMDNDGKLNESEAITAGDLNALISNIGLGWIDLDSITVTTIKDDTKLNRRNAAVLIVSAIYGSKVADLKGIFKSKFADVAEDSKYVGYIAISDAAGLITGNSAGNFRPTKAFTRGEALKLVYNFLAKA